MIDLDSTVCEVHGHAKQGAAYGYTKCLGSTTADELAVARKLHHHARKPARPTRPRRLTPGLAVRRAADPSKRQKPLRHPPKLVQHTPKPDEPAPPHTRSQTPPETAAQEVRRWIQAQTLAGSSVGVDGAAVPFRGIVASSSTMNTTGMNTERGAWATVSAPTAM